MSQEDIRKDLADIRHYYFRKDMFDKAEKIVGTCSIKNKVDKYNKIICEFPPKLYDYYVSMYIFGNTQEGLADEMCCSVTNMATLSRVLVETLEEILNKGE